MTTDKSDTRHGVRRIGFWAGIAGFAVVWWLAPHTTLEVPAQRVAAVAILMAIWWIFEAIPIPATALIPLALFPALGILNAKATSAAYGDHNIFLFAGGFFIAMAMQKWNLHERIALAIIARTGTSGSRLVLGFMIATAFLSMWVSNTATAMMMVPIATAIVASLEKTARDDIGPIATALFLGIAYAASIGGIATLIGTPPNTVLAAQMSALYPDAPKITTAQWIWVGVPVVALMLPAAYLILTRIAIRLPHIPASPETNAIVAERRQALGPMSKGERVVLVISGLTAGCWIVRPYVDALFPMPGYVQDSTVAMFFAVLLFLIPVDRKAGEYALDWEWAQRIPWGILLLFGGGIALADGFRSTGLVEWAGNQLSILASVPPLAMIVAVAILLTFLTELTSNTATTQIFLPILAVTASQVLHVHPLLLMVPATISASCAFMLPVATPPNAVVFASGTVTVPQMAKAGFLLNLAGVVIVTLITYLLLPFAFGLHDQPIPALSATIPTP